MRETNMSSFRSSASCSILQRHEIGHDVLDLLRKYFRAQLQQTRDMLGAIAQEGRRRS